MNYKILILLTLLLVFVPQKKVELPEGFVHVKEVIPDLDVELRYYSTNNFIGDTI